MNILIKSIYSQFIRLFKSVKYYRFLRSKSPYITSDFNSFKQQESNLDIVTIAFNNDKMIEYQIQLLRKYIIDSFVHIIADNSNDYEISIKIRSICEKYGVLYVAIPYIKLKPSFSHAAAMHWVYVNIIHPRSPSYFGFIDHDIFPITQTSILNNMWNGVYGRVIPPYGTKEISMNQKYWSLWAGCFFIQFSALKKHRPRKVNFYPKYLKNGLVLDTGGGLWDTLLNDLPLPKTLMSYEQINISDNEKYLLQSDAYEKLDDWVHIVNLSNWYKANDMKKKISYFETFLNDLLK